jgi:hypothetical protein
MALYHYVSKRAAPKHSRDRGTGLNAAGLNPSRAWRACLNADSKLSSSISDTIINAGNALLNAKIRWVKVAAQRIRDRQNFINAIYFHCGGLDLNPLPTK